MGIQDKKLDILQALYLFMDRPTGGASTTLDAAALAGAATFTVASATNIAVGDDLRVGSGETMELVRVGGLAGTTVTPDKPLKFAHASGEAVVEQSAFNFGVPEADGFRVTFNAESTDVFTAVTRLAYTTINGYVDLGGSWRWPTVTADALAISLGLPRTGVIGDGTAAHQTGTAGPRLFTADGATFGAIRNVNLVAVGRLKDESYFKLDLYNLSFNPTSFSVQFARGQLSTVPCQVLASSGTSDFTGTLWTPAHQVQTYAASKGDVFAAITALARLADSGTTTTTTAEVAAGAYTIPVTSATGITAGAWIKIGTGDLAEWHLVHGVATLNVNLRTQVQRVHANGAAIVVQAKSVLGLAQGGVTLAGSGSMRTDRSEYSRVSLGQTPENVAVALSGNLDTMTPETWMTALGIAASHHANDVIPLGNSIASAAGVTMLFEGLTASGKMLTICGWDGAATVGGEVQLTQAATAQLPFSYKPRTLQVMVNA